MEGHTPRLTWKPNPDGATRSIDEAVRIARKHGVGIPKHVDFFVDNFRLLDSNTTARGPKITKAAGEIVAWDDLLNKFGKVPFILRPDILKSDEAIVAVIAHEMHELKMLKPLLQDGKVTIEQFGAHTSPDNPDNFHFEAWEIADGLVEEMRRQGSD